MAKRTCPFCGKSIPPEAQYCIYCSKEVGTLAPSDQTSKQPANRKAKSGHYKGLFGLAVTMASLLVIAVIVVLVVVFPPDHGGAGETDPSTLPVTTTTRDAAHDEWTQTFLGQWIDEQSAGKKSLEDQGGYILYIHEVFRDTVTFDLLSYQG